MFRSEAGESCKRRLLRDLPAMEGAFGPYQHAECSNDGLCHVRIQPAGRFIAEQNTRVVYELGRYRDSTHFSSRNPLDFGPS